MECSTENQTNLFDFWTAAIRTIINCINVIKDESSIDIFCDKYIEKYQDRVRLQVSTAPC